MTAGTVTLMTSTSRAEKGTRTESATVSSEDGTAGEDGTGEDGTDDDGAGEDGTCEDGTDEDGAGGRVGKGNGDQKQEHSET